MSRRGEVKITDNQGQIADIDADGGLVVSSGLGSISGGIQSALNTTTTPLTSGSTYTGTFEQNDHPDVQVSCITDKAGTLYFDFSVDGTNVNTFPTAGFTVSAGIHEFHNAVKGPRYFRVRFVDGGAGDQTYLRIYTYYGQFRQGNLPLNQSISSDADAIITRSVLVGEDELGAYQNIRSDNQGNIKVSIGGPVAAFGEVLTAYNNPIFQANAIYGLGSKMRTSVSGTGAAAGAANNLFYASSGTSAAGVATVFSKEAAIYKSGQGLSFPFTAIFPSPVANQVQWAGPQNATDGITIGYNGTTFGCFFRHWGKHEIRTLTLTTPASGATNATVTLNGTAYTVALSVGTLAKNAQEIADSLTLQQTAFNCFQVGATVVIRSSTARVVSGAFAFSHASAVGAYTTQSTGVAVTEEFTAGTDFTEGNVLSWLDPAKLNVFRVDVQYLGAGDIDIYAEYDDPKEYILIHRIHYSNENTAPSLTNPSFRVGWTSSNRGSTTSATVSGASLGAFVQGEFVISEPDRSVYNAKTNTTETIIFMIKVADVLNGKVNVATADIESLSVTTESTKGCVFKLIVNPTTIATGIPNWSYVEEGISPLLTDVSATTLTGGRTIETILLGNGGSRSIDLSTRNLPLLPGDVIAVTAAVTSGAAALNSASLTLKVDL